MHASVSTAHVTVTRPLGCSESMILSSLTGLCCSGQRLRLGRLRAGCRAA